MGVSQAAAGALGARALLAAGAARTLGLALSLVGGPVGAALLGAGVAVAYLATQATEGKAATDRYGQALASLRPPAEDAKAAVKGVGDQVADTNAKMNLAAQETFRSTLRQDAAEARNLETSIRGAAAGLEQFGAAGLKAEDKKRGLDLVKAGMEGNEKGALAAADELRRLGETNISFANAFGAIATMIERLAAVRAAAAQTQSALAGVQAAGAAEQAAKTRRDEQAALERSGFKADTALPDVNADSTIAALRLQNKVRLGTMDKNKKELQDKADELYNAALAEGGGITRKQATDAAQKIIDAQDAQKGGGKGGGGKTDGEKAEDRINRYVDSLARQNLVLQAEIDNFSKSNIEKRAAIELAKAGVDLNRLDATTREEMLAKLQKEIGLSEELRTKLKGLEDQKKAINDANQFFAESVTDSLTDLIVNGERAEDVLKNLVKQLAKAAIQATLMGSGPLGGIFGMKGTDGGVGGLIGMAISGFSLPGKAAGGPVQAGQPYMVGERRPELFIPSTSGRIVPRPQSGGAITLSPTYSIDARGSQMSEGQMRAILAENNARLRSEMPGYLTKVQQRGGA